MTTMSPQVMVTIRMKRGGRKKAPVYTIVASDSRAPRDGRILEKLGLYHPNKEKGQELDRVKTEAIRARVAQGARVSDTVRTLLVRNGLGHDIWGN